MSRHATPLGPDALTDAGVGLGEGRTLPWAWYLDPAVTRVESERVFARTWHYVGPAAAVASPGTFATYHVAHVPVVVVRDKAGELRGFVNVCRHRGAEVAREPEGTCSTLQCFYHAWTYDLDGSLRSGPRLGPEGLDKGALSLVPVQVGVWGPFLWVNPDPAAPPLLEWLGDLPALVADAGLDVDRLRLHSRLDYPLECNWKVAVENYLECYHCPTAHPSFAAVMDVSAEAYELGVHARHGMQRGPLREVPRGGEGIVGYHADGGEIPQGQYHLVWPSVKININPGRTNLSIGPLYPDGPGRTRAVLDYWFGDDVPAEWIAQMLRFDDTVGAEDTALIASAQQGMASGLVPHGTVMPESEQLITAFGSWLLSMLGDPA